MVVFTDSERLIGDVARSHMFNNLSNTIFDVKRLIGRRFDESLVQEDMKHWPFTVTNDGGRPKIKIQLNDECKTYFPEEISAMVLVAMKEAAVARLGPDVTDAVITVPAYFNDGQRQATKDAGIIAGLNILQIINEPTAAAIAYAFDKKVSQKMNVLVFDLGGGTFDVSIMTIENGNYEVKAVAGDTHLGGVDFDNRMMNHFITEFKKKHNVDLSGDKKAVQRLRAACENAKRILSVSINANLEIPNIYKDIDLYENIYRAQFEDLNDDLFRSTLDHVKKALTDAALRNDEINEIILVGGSSRIPMIQSLLQDFFNGKPLNKSINADEAVAYGAAVKAAMLSDEIRNIVVTDVTPLSLGVETVGGVMSTIINRNTKVPIKKTSPYVTSADNQTSASINVYEGEGALTKDNFLLGTFVLSGIPPMPRGDAKLEITLDLDANGILNVSAVEMSTGTRKDITIVHDKGRFTKEEIEMKIAEAEKYKMNTMNNNNLILAKNTLLSSVNHMRSMMDDDNVAEKLTIRDGKNIESKCSEIISWLNDNPNLSTEKYENQKERF